MTSIERSLFAVIFALLGLAAAWIAATGPEDDVSPGRWALVAWSLLLIAGALKLSGHRKEDDDTNREE